jgi:hypothetical protein
MRSSPSFVGKTSLRPSGSAVATSPARLHLSLLCDLQRVVDLDAKVSDGALSELI